MKIVHISTSDLGHGAGIAAYRIHRSLKKIGLDSRMLVTEKISDDPLIEQIKNLQFHGTGGLLTKLHLKIERALNLLGPQNLYSVIGWGLNQRIYQLKPDVLHFHNIHWSSRNLSLLSLAWARKISVVWTIHDMWPMTGHCFYSYQCERWRIGCGRCPDVKGFVELMYDSSALQWRIKKVIYDKYKPIIVTPSQWLESVAKQNPLFRKCLINRIGYPIDQELFRNYSRDETRNEFGLTKEDKVVLFVSPSSDHRKGFKYFKEALGKLRFGKKLVILILGRNMVINNLRNHFMIKEIEYIRDPKVLAKIYSTANVYVIPSLQDNLPNTVLESLACGTPVVGFRVGGIPDMVDHGVNGYLAEVKDVQGLAKGIEMFLNDDELTIKAGKWGMEKVARMFSETVIAQQYLKLYKNALERKNDFKI